MPWIFGITMFVSATLLFLVQPMVGKMILPLLGGTPAVWNSCMVFFQALLLAGYFYAHKLSSSSNAGRQTMIHIAVLGVAVAALAFGAVLSGEHSPVPVVKSLAPQGSEMPFFGVIALLTAAIGLPFFTVSTTAPLLQKWFADTGHPSAKDPYFLYAASNAGSLLALFAYPAVIEPFFRVIDQAWIWAIGFVILTVMLVVCGRTLTKAKLANTAREQNQPQKKSANTDSEPAPTLWDWIRWPMLSAVPSSLMLSVTTEIVTDVISTPLIWIVPLALYLITFIIVFSKSTPKSVHTLMTLSTPVLILLMVFLKTSGVSPKPEWISFALRVLCFFVVTMVCHGELARARPSSKYLTAFYLSMSFGGMLGGLFNAFVAPIMFVHVSEYPISLVAACLVLPPLSQVLANLTGDKTPPAPKPQNLKAKVEAYWYIVAPFVIFIIVRVLTMYYSDISDWISKQIEATNIRADERSLARILIYGFPALLCYLLIEKPRIFGAAVACFWAASFLTDWKQENKKKSEEELNSNVVVYVHSSSMFSKNIGLDTDEKWPYYATNIEVPYRTVNRDVNYSRSFFGTMKVEREPINTRLVHGTTLHGMQCRWTNELELAALAKVFTSTNPLDAATLQTTLSLSSEGFGRERPLTYYHRTGPVGDMFRVFRQKVKDNPKTNTAVACIGLGTGSLSTYGEPGEQMTFFEIDQHVKDLVDEPNTHFTYLANARKRGVPMEFEMGDARLTLERLKKKWGFMLVDAFSSDAIPAHLLTKESLQLYLDRVEDDAIVAIHISNRYLDLEPVVEKIAKELGIAARVRHDYDQRPIGKTASTWIAISRKPEGLGPILNDKRWEELASRSDVNLWSDDFTPLLNVLKPDYLQWLPGERQMVRPRTIRLESSSSEPK